MSPYNYNEAIQDNDVTLQQKDNEYWSLVSSLYRVKPIGNLQEEENGRYKDKNLMDMTGSEGKISLKS